LKLSIIVLVCVGGTTRETSLSVDLREGQVSVDRGVRMLLDSAFLIR
jgi:hypothetical protein